MFTKKRKIIFQVDICIEQDGSSYHAFCPALQGIHVDGQTEKEALDNVQLAVTLYLKSLMKHGEPIPLQMQLVETQEVCRSQSHPSLTCPPKHTQNILVTV